MKSGFHLSRRRSRLSNQRGVALVIVLWIFIFLFVVAFDFSASVREEATAALRYRDETEGYYLAVAGFQRGLYDFLNQPSGRELRADQAPMDLFDGSWREAPFGNGIFRVRLVDESGKININRADDSLLRRIFTNLGIEEPRISILIDSILDWRDPDDLHRISGAENDFYGSLALPYSAKNGPFDMVEDLLWVRGVTSALFHGYSEDPRETERDREIVGLKEIFTVDGPLDRVNLRTAPAAVIHALAGISLERSRAFVEERKKLADKSIADLLTLLGAGSGAGTQQVFVIANPSVFSVEAEGLPGGHGVPRRVKGVVRAGGGQQRFELLRWIDRDFPLPRQ